MLFRSEKSARIDSSALPASYDSPTDNFIYERTVSGSRRRLPSTLISRTMALCATAVVEPSNNPGEKPNAARPTAGVSARSVMPSSAFRAPEGSAPDNVVRIIRMSECSLSCFAVPQNNPALSAAAPERAYARRMAFAMQPQRFGKRLPLSPWTHSARARFNDSVTLWEVATLPHCPGFVTVVQLKSIPRQKNTAEARGMGVSRLSSL